MASFGFDACQYTVETTLKGKPKMLPCGPGMPKALLKGITADVRAGHVLAIMGPSGAGKTTLLNMLTLEKKGGAPTGTLTLNGHPFTLALYKKHCAYVQQQDALWACLNARDHLTYAYDLFQPQLSTSDRDVEVEKTLKTLGLTEVQTVKAGNQFFRGLSGGLKRRLSIGIALAKNPLVLMLDEPTTGVDSASASMIMSFLKTVAAERQIAVLCTIHQPPASVFAGFDDTLILASGRIAYFGAASELGTYLAKVGKTPPTGVNMAEFALDLVNRDFSSPIEVDAILDAWAKQETPSTDDGAPLKPLPEPPTRAGFIAQCATLTRRAWSVALREPIQYTGRMAAIFFSVAFFGILFLSSRDLTQQEVQIRAFFLMFALGIPAQFMMVTVFAEYFTVVSIRREVKDGMYHPAAAAIASWIIQVPFMFVLSSCALVPAFAVGNLHWPAFGMALLIHAALFWSFEGMAQAQALEPSPLLGLMNFMNLFFMAFLFCGMFVSPDDVIWPFKLFTYIMPLLWTMKAFLHAVFTNSPAYAGVLPCTAGTMLSVDYLNPVTGMNTTRGAYCLSHKGRPGYYCPEDPDGYLCFGANGADILDSLGARFTIFDSDVSYATCIVYVLLFGAFFRLIYIIRLTIQCSAAMVPKPPSDTATDAKPQSDATVHEGLEHAITVADASVAQEAAAPTVPVTTVPVTTFTGEATFTNVSYEIAPGMFKGGGEPKQILKGLSASVGTGEVLAIIGPSGSGKTTLLNALTLEPGPGKPTGLLAINGHALTAGTYLKYCAYVPREDNLWATMTARAHLQLAFECYRPELGGAAREAKVDELLAATGMESCQHTKAGDMLRPGLSGGQRRRLSMALALVKEPKMIILDEPTSGLDSAAAAAITKLLGNIAKRTASTIVCTIHQPSAAVLAGFQKLCVISEGRTAYCGPTEGLGAHLASLGHPVPPNCNPAEFALELISRDVSSAEAVKAILDAWQGKVEPTSTTESAPKEPLPQPPPTAGLCMQTLVLTKRAARQAIADPIFYIVRMIMTGIMISFFGLIYKESAKNINPQATFRLFFLWWVLAVPVSLNLITVLIFNVELKTVKTEIKNGMYSPIAYVISSTIVQLPFMFGLAFFALVPAFGIGGWSWSHFGTFFLAYTASAWGWECLAQLMSLMGNPVLGMLNYVSAWSAGILFCGLVFRGEEVIWPLRTFYYILPMKWLFNSAAYDVYMPAVYTDAQLCTPMVDPACTMAGFKCANLTSINCFGHTGEQVLDTLHYSFDALTSDDERALDLGAILAFAVAVKLMYAVGVVMATKSTAKLQPASKTKSASEVTAVPKSVSEVSSSA